MNETYATVTGNLIGTVNHRTLADGTSVASFRVASNQRRFDRVAGQWTNGDVLYVSVTCWRRLADNVSASFVANDPVVVHGRLYSREYEKDGVRRWVTEMEALAVGPDLTRCTAAVRRAPRPACAAPLAVVSDTAADLDGAVVPGQAGVGS